MSFNKYFTSTVLASDVDWEDRAAVIRLWHDRLDGWYFVPIEEMPKTGHEAFVALLSVIYVLKAVTRYAMDGCTYETELLDRIDARFCEAIPSTGGRHVSYDFSGLIEALDTGNRLSDYVGISGTGRLSVDVDGVTVFDPWIVRDVVREWFSAKCERLATQPNGNEARELCRALRRDFEVKA